MAIDIGLEAIDRSQVLSGTATMFGLNNPANATGSIDTIEIWKDIRGAGTDFAAIFFLVSGTTYECRDSESLGDVSSGSKQTISGLDISVETGDYLGWYNTDIDATLVRDGSGFEGVRWTSGEHKDPSDQASYTLFSGDGMSLYGTGTEVGGADLTKSLSDTITIADSISKAPGLIKSDSVGIADAVSKGSGLGKSDSIAIADSVALVAEFKRAFSDTVVIAEGISKQPGLVKSDSLAIADSISKQPGLNKSDTITISDAFSKAMTYLRNLSDTIIMSDSISKTISMIKSDTIAIVDSIVIGTMGQALTIILSDIITITDKVKLSYPVRRAVAIGRMTIKRIASARLPYKKIHEEDV